MKTKAPKAVPTKTTRVVTDGQPMTAYQQYDAIKTLYPDVLVCFRMGDFYELWGADAETAASVLEITLTSRGIGAERRSMCGFPVHASERYVARLIAEGYRVALCESGDKTKRAK